MLLVLGKVVLSLFKVVMQSLDRQVVFPLVVEVQHLAPVETLFCLSVQVHKKEVTFN
jgi:hypothetical protein